MILGDTPTWSPSTETTTGSRLITYPTTHLGLRRTNWSKGCLRRLLFREFGKDGKQGTNGDKNFNGFDDDVISWQ